MPATQKGGSEGHEVRDGVVAIADQFMQDIGDEGEGFGVVQAHTAGEAFLGEEAGLGDDEFVDLAMKLIMGC